MKVELWEGHPEKVSSLRAEYRGRHAHLSVWFRGKLSGVLVVGEDEVAALAKILLSGRVE